VLTSGVKCYDLSGRFYRTNKQIERIVGSTFANTPLTAQKTAKEMFLRILAQPQCIMRRKPTRSRKMSIGREADATE